jgi:hypothetical protein
MGYLIDHLRIWQEFALVSLPALLVAVVSSGFSITSRYHAGHGTLSAEGNQSP